MDGEDDFLGSLGLGKLLASEGVDSSGLSTLLSRGGGGGEASTSAQFADVDNQDSDEDAKYEDDLSDNDLPETEGEKAARAKERQEEARYKRMALQMSRELEVSRAAKGKGKEKATNDPQSVVKKIWPDFQPGRRLRMTDVLYETPQMRHQYERESQRKKRRKVDPHIYHDLGRAQPCTDQAQAFLTDLSPLHAPRSDDPLYKTRVGLMFDETWVNGARDLLRKRMTEPPKGISYIDPVIEEDWAAPTEAKALDLADWEKDIIMYSLDAPKTKLASDPLQPRNDLLITGDWLHDIIWDATRVSPELVDEPIITGTARLTDSQALDGPQAAPADSFNVSNDNVYEHTREARFRIRQTFGAIEVFHSQPAKTLQMPFYKTSLNKTEARSWRRPALQFPQGVSITLHKLKNNPSASISSKKKQVMADPSERFKSTKDLTMSEKGPCVLLEFSEEYPPIMSGYGMGTTIVNYYRKKDDRDETVPKLDFGQPSILNPSDAEPFMLGYVDRGKVTQVIHNNLIRAPIYQHKPATTDFLIIRQTINGHATYYIRSINNLFTVGQTVPNESEVAGPHARKNTNTAKTRLMIVAWLLIQKSREKRIKLATLMKYFPDQSELQMRQRLKVKGNEFLVYARHPSPNVGYWLLNDAYDFPKDRKSVVEQCTPEQAMLYEAMQVGQRQLYDAGYAKTAEGNAEEEMGDDSTLDIEQQLAVWSTTKNYKLAEAAKAWLLLHGEGDPTGRGEGFSFLRTNMKNYFLRKGETDAGRRLEAERNGQLKISNAEQNRIYEEEKRKVWDLQAQALSNPVPPTLDAEDEDRSAPTPAGWGPRIGRSESRRAFSRGHSLAATPFADSPREMSPSQYSADGESNFTGNPYGGKVLRIKRIVKGKEQFEIVRDPAVIQSYLKRVEERKVLEYMKRPELLKPSGNPEEDELKRVALMKAFEKIKKNQERRLARKKYEARSRPDFDGELDTSKRRCGACGMVGHTKANRNCPMFNSSSVAPSPVAATPAIPTPGTAAYSEYFAQNPESETANKPGTSFKIRLGGFNKTQQ